MNQNGVPIPSSVIQPQPFPHQAMIDPNSVLHVCPRIGERETWEIDNVSTELHNFHLHQTKFRLARPGDAGLPAGFTVNDAVVDPTNQLKPLMPEFSVTGVAGVDVFHDSLPVPAAKPSGANAGTGKLFVSTPFFAPQQVGTYVFHCHILEHEDGGMMAVVQVYDPLSTASLDPLTQFAQLTASGAICRTPVQ